MATRSLASCPLNNGLTLFCMDKSKKIAADRWYVCIQVEITIPVEKKWFANHPVDEETFQKMSRALGKEIVFRQKKERNFVSNNEKEQIVKNICDRAVDTGIKYLGHEDFAAKYLLKVFRDQHRDGWR